MEKQWKAPAGREVVGDFAPDSALKQRRSDGGGEQSDQLNSVLCSYVFKGKHDEEREEMVETGLEFITNSPSLPD